MKKIINSIMFWLGYVPSESPILVGERSLNPVIVREVSRKLTPIGLHSKFEMESYMNALLRDMRHEIADMSSDSFEVIKEKMPMGFASDLSSRPDEFVIKMRLKIINP